MTSKLIKLLPVIFSTTILATPILSQADETGATAPDQPVTAKLVDSLIKLADGPHKGYRANHAKGIMAEGIFEPAPDAASLTKAAHLQGTPSKVIVRFSNATGVPNMPDASPHAHPHGIAIRFLLPDESSTDIVSISINSFPASTPEEFLALLKSVEASGPNSTKPSPVEVFLANHPAAAKFVAPLPAPASFANTPFYGVNAFKFTNAKGLVSYGRYLITPVAGAKNLSASEAEKAKPDYLMDDLKTRLDNTEIKFNISAQIAAKDDVLNDATITWPADRTVVNLGVLTIKSALQNSNQQEKTIMFNPLSLPDGIEPSDDPILLARPGAYAVSYGKRLAQ